MNIRITMALFIIFCIIVKIKPTTRAISYNVHYLKAEKCTLDTSQYGNLAAAPWNSYFYTVSYLNSYPYAVNISVLLTIQ